MEPLLSMLGMIDPLSPGLSQYFRGNLEPWNVAAGKCILTIEGRCRYIYYIESGLVMSCHFLNGKRVTTYFNKENNIFMSVHGYLRQMPSREEIYALEDCILWRLPYEKHQHIYDRFPEFNKHGRILTERYYAIMDDMQYMLRMQKPMDIYAQMMANGDELLNRVPVKYMASYLDVSVRHFARIKKNFSEGKTNFKNPKKKK